MGHIKKAKDNKWRLVVECGLDPSTGKRRRLVRVVTGSRRDAERELARLEAEFQQGRFFEPSRQPLGEYLLWWVEAVAKPGLKPGTYEAYRWYIERHINPVMGHIPLGCLAPIHVQEFYSFKAADGRLDGKGALSSRSVVYIHSILRQALEKAVALELVLKNPCQQVTPPRLKRRAPRDYVVLDASQLSKFLEFCRGHRDYALIFTAAYTGMRQSELLGLQWEHVLWNDSSIKVEQSLNLLEGGVPYVGATKNASSSRVVKVAEGVMKVLREHKKAQAQRQLKEQGAFANQHNLVFPDARTGGYENRKRVSARFKRLAEKAGYPGLRFHDLRHIHATILLTAGEFVKVVSQRLGHADVDTTLRTYAHVLPKQQDEAARKFAELLSGRG